MPLTLLQPAPASQPILRSVPSAWLLRDWIAAFVLFASTAGVILWQNAQVAILWDLSYVLDSASRIAAGQMPYRDFPFAHAPLTFLVQAAIIKLTGRVYFHHVIYITTVGGVGSVLTWRIALHTLRGRIAAAWWIALLLAAPLAVIGIYCIVPFPSYDCDCAFSMLVAIRLMQRLTPDEDSGFGTARETSRAFVAGAALCVPIFFKQNMGLPFFAAAVGAVVFILFVRPFRHNRQPSQALSTRTLLAVLAGAATALLIAALILGSTAGIGNYVHWTIRFAAKRRLPGFADMIGVYLYPSLAWMLACMAVALILLSADLGKRRWAQIAAFVLLSMPFLFTLASLLIYDDIDERGDTLLELWPLLLLLAAAMALVNLVRSRHNLDLRALLPFVLLIAVNGTMMSQQLWGSTYAIWPLLILLLAEMFVFLEGCESRNNTPSWFTPALAALVSATFLICGGFYTASDDRLSYAQLPDGPAMHSAFPELASMATPGPYLPQFDELLRYAQSNIPFDDGLILLPGEDPFYFATGRVPRFPVLLFDKSTEPYSPDQLAALVRARNIRWLILKLDLQIKEDPTPDRDTTVQALTNKFTLVTHLHGYDVYHR